MLVRADDEGVSTVINDAKSKRIQKLLDQNAVLQAEIVKLKKILAENGIAETDITHSDIKSIYDPDQGARIKRESITRQYVRLFFSRFWGREDVYSKRVVKKNGESRVFHSVQEFLEGRVLSQNRKQQIFNHLTGKEVIGIYPYLSDGTCRFLAFDFDNHTEGAEKNDFTNAAQGWVEEVCALRTVCKEAGIDPFFEDAGA